MTSKNRILTNKHFLKYLSHCGSKQRKSLVNSASTDELDSICEIIYNIYQRNIPISPLLVQKLKKFRRAIERIGTKPRQGNTIRRRILNQRGGAILPLLLSAAIPSLISLFKKDT